MLCMIGNKETSTNNIITCLSEESFISIMYFNLAISLTRLPYGLWVTVINCVSLCILNTIQKATRVHY